MSRLRLDAQRYAFPDRNAPRRRGPKPLTGKRLPSLKARVQEALAYGKDLEIPWYGGTTRRVRVLSNTRLWYTPGEPPVAIRWVLIVDPSGKTEPMAVFTTDLDQSVAMIMAALPMRQQEALFTSLAARLSRAVSPDLRENSCPSTPPGHSVLDISPVYLGGVLRPLSPDDDLLGEMLEDRR